MNWEFQIPVTGSTTPNSGLEVRSDWLWPQLGQYWAPSGSSELQYQQEPTAGILPPGAEFPAKKEQGGLVQIPSVPEPNAPPGTRLWAVTFEDLVGQKEVGEGVRGVAPHRDPPSDVLR